MTRPSREDVLKLGAYLEEEVTASERETLETQLRESADARRTLEQLQGVRELLSAPAERLERMDLASSVLARARELGPVAAAPPRSFRKAALAGLFAAAAGLCLVLLFPDREAREFRAKSSGAQLERARWAGVHVFRARGNAAAEPLGNRLESGDSLVFTYTNLGAHPYRYLMIFSIDSANQVRWFYPAYEFAGENPESMPVEAGRANVPLGELVQQDFSLGPLALYALFTNQPVRVLDVEAWLKQRGRAPDEAPQAGDFLQRFDIRVE